MSKRRFAFGIVGIATCIFAAMIGDDAKSQLVGDFELGDTCSYFGESLPDNVKTFASDSEAENAIQDIIEKIGLVPRFETMAAGVPNAAAVIQDGRRYVLYNQRFMYSLRQETGSKWAPISILAHEIGHHLNAHTLDRGGSRPDLELEADYFSGNVLQRMGADLDDALAAMDLLGSSSGSSTHPGKRDRLAAITNGWMRACRDDEGCSSSGDGGGGNMANSCEYAHDGTCDEPEYCERGTDTADCGDGDGGGGGGNMANSCEYAHDGTCDEPEYCERGTDTADCGDGDGGGGGGNMANSCEYAHDGTCDEPEYCERGTDTADCSGPPPITQQQMSNVCYTQYGACEMWQAGVRGTSCFCNYYGTMIPGLIQ